MKQLIAFSLATAFAGSVVASPILVTSSADRGAGSLRAAIAEASRGNGPQEIIVAADGDIVLNDTLSYSGRAPLTLTGQAQTLKIQANATLLEVTEGADLSVSGLRFQGPAGYSIENRGDTNGQTAGKGIFVDIRDDQIWCRITKGVDTFDTIRGHKHFEIRSLQSPADQCPNCRRVVDGENSRAHAFTST